ncbi:hypothetical protein [Rothia dentocariosa]|uniref:hypothetical protein n=1 Tax=Rothia dentocariosa TaxID=2047 RepID=UPI0028E50395|nr:hypothetical protein [Rothia dentocariosa]
MNQEITPLEEITEQELTQASGAGTCENLKARLDGKKWPPATLAESVYYYFNC